MDSRMFLVPKKSQNGQKTLSLVLYFCKLNDSTIKQVFLIARIDKILDQSVLYNIGSSELISWGAGQGPFWVKRVCKGALPYPSNVKYVIQLKLTRIIEEKETSLALINYYKAFVIEIAKLTSLMTKLEISVD